MIDFLAQIFGVKRYSITSPIFGKLTKNGKSSYWIGEFDFSEEEDPAMLRLELIKGEESKSLIELEALWKKIGKKLSYLIEVTREELSTQQKRPFQGDFVLRGIETEEGNREALMLYYELFSEEELKENMIVIRATPE